MQVHMCVTSSCFIKECNKVNIASAYCSALACRTAAVDNDRKRWWLTQWKNKGTCYCMQLLPGLHQWQHREYAMYLGIQRCTHHRTQVHFLSRGWRFTPFPHVSQVGTTLHVHVHTLTWGFWVNLDLVIIDAVTLLWCWGIMRAIVSTAGSYRGSS